MSFSFVTSADIRDQGNMDLGCKYMWYNHKEYICIYIVYITVCFKLCLLCTEVYLYHNH